MPLTVMPWGLCSLIYFLALLSNNQSFSDNVMLQHPSVSTRIYRDHPIAWLAGWLLLLIWSVSRNSKDNMKKTLNPSAKVIDWSKLRCLVSKHALKMSILRFNAEYQRYNRELAFWDSVSNTLHLATVWCEFWVSRLALWLSLVSRHVFP